MTTTIVIVIVIVLVITTTTIKAESSDKQVERKRQKVKTVQRGQSRLKFHVVTTQKVWWSLDTTQSRPSGVVVDIEVEYLSPPVSAPAQWPKGFVLATLPWRLLGTLICDVTDNYGADNGYLNSSRGEQKRVPGGWCSRDTGKWW
jgi:hypothetical protein